jgi:hypothetical protein
MMAAGLAGLLLAIGASVVGMTQVFGWSNEFQIIYSPDECIGWDNAHWSSLVSSAEKDIGSATDCALFQSAQRDKFANDLHTLVAVAGTAALLTGTALSVGFRALLRRHAAGEDYSPAGNAHAVTGLAFFAIVSIGLALWLALLIANTYNNSALGYWIGAGLVATVPFLAGYTRAAYRAFT